MTSSPAPLWPATTPCPGGTCSDAETCLCDVPNWAGRGDFIYAPNDAFNASTSTSTCLVYVPAVRALWALLAALAVVQLPFAAHVARVAWRLAGTGRRTLAAAATTGPTKPTRTWTWWIATLLAALQVPHIVLGGLHAADPLRRTVGGDPLTTVVYCTAQLLSRWLLYCQAAQIHAVVRGMAKMLAHDKPGGRAGPSLSTVTLSALMRASRPVFVGSALVSLAASTAPLFMFTSTTQFPATFAWGAAFFLGICVPLTVQEVYLLVFSRRLLLEIGQWTAFASPLTPPQRRTTTDPGNHAVTGKRSSAFSAPTSPTSESLSTGLAASPKRTSAAAVAEPEPMRSDRVTLKRVEAHDRMLRIYRLTMLNAVFWTAPDYVFGVFPVVQASFAWVVLPVGYILGNLTAYALMRNLIPTESWPAPLRPFFSNQNLAVSIARLLGLAR